MECKLVEDFQHNTSLPLPTVRQNYSLYLPLSTRPDSTPMTSSLISDPTSAVTDSKQDTPQISHNRRETPEGFTMPHNPEISPNQLNLTSESETSFLSLVPNKLFDLTTPTTSHYMPAVNSSVRNAKSSIDFLEDMNNEILMLNQSKCHTPMVFISKKASPYPLMEKIISSSQTVGSFDRNQQGDNYAQLDVISDNHDVLKWDYAGDIASNHLGVPRIISHSSLSCHPVNYVDYGNYDVNMTMTWPSSSPHISPSSGYGYAVRRKYNFNTRNNSNRNWNESSKIKGFNEFSSMTINHGSFISSPDPEDEIHNLSLNNSMNQINHFIDHYQSSLNDFNIDLLDQDHIKSNMNTNSSEFSLNDENDNENIEKFNFNKSQSVIELHHHIDMIKTRTGKYFNHNNNNNNNLLHNIDQNRNGSNTMISMNNDWFINEFSKSYNQSIKTLKSININNQLITNDIMNNNNNNNGDIKDDHNEQETLANSSVHSNCRLVNELDENNNNNDDELQSLLEDNQHDLSSLQATSALDTIETDSYLHTNNNIPKQEISTVQPSTCSKDLSQSPLNNFNEPEEICYIVDGVLSSAQDTNNYSAITTVTPLNYQNGFDAESEGCRSSVIMDENCEKEITPNYYDAHNELEHLLIKNTDIKIDEISKSFTPSIQNDKVSMITTTPTTTNGISICKSTQNDMLTTECKWLSDNMNITLSNVYPTIFSNGIQLVTQYTTHNSPYIHYTASKINSNNLPEYIPSQYSNLSMTGYHSNHVIQNIPTCVTVFSQTDTTLMKQEHCLSSSSVENKVPRNKFNETEIISRENTGIHRMFHIPKTSTSQTIDLSSLNVNKQSKDLSSIYHHHHIRSTVTSSCNTGITTCPLLTQNMKVQHHENNKPNEYLTCKHYLSKDDFESNSIILSPICTSQPITDYNDRIVQNDVNVYKVNCVPTHSCHHSKDNVKKFDTKLVQTIDFNDQNECTCYHTYRIQPGINESTLNPEWIEQLLTYNTKLDNNQKSSQEYNKHKITQSVYMTPRSTLIAQLRYILLKQKLKLLHTRDAYYLRKRIVNHLEKFLDQIISSNTLPLSNSVPDDWDTDTESLLSDLFEKDNDPISNELNTGNSPKLKPSTQQCNLLTDEHGENEQINKKMLNKQSSSSYDREICNRNAHFEEAQKDVQQADNTNKTECKDNDKQFTDIKKQAENQLSKMVMNVHVNQPSSLSICKNLNETLSRFIHRDHHVKGEKSFKDHCSLNTNIRLYPSSDDIVNGVCAALGGISWFQPFNDNYINKEKHQPIRNHSVIRHTKLNDHFDLKHNPKSFKEFHLNSKRLHILNKPNNVHTSKISYSMATNNKDLKTDHNEVNDICSCQCYIEESPDIINDKNQEQTVTSKSLVDIQCTKLHHMENTTPLLHTVDKSAHEEKPNSLSNPKITYEISDNLDGCTDIQDIFRKKMSSWISRSEERQRRLRFIIQERRYRKEGDMKRTEVLHSVVSNNFSKRPSISHLDQSYKNHYGNRIHSNGDSGICCFDRSDCSIVQSVLTNRNNSNNYIKTANSDKVLKRNFMKNPSRKSQLGVRYDRKQLVQEEHRPRLYHNSIQNQVNQQKIKLAQLRVNRLRMKIYSEIL
ncbi:unnamed protein product [Schistosoma bovis]|nr:unnamed protein product [Schistosoma bovis]